MAVFPVLIPLILALLAAPAALLAGALKPAYAPPIGTIFAALAALATLWGWLSGGGALDIAWVPSWDVRLPINCTLGCVGSAQRCWMASCGRGKA